MKAQIYLDKENEEFVKNIANDLNITTNQAVKLLYSQGKELVNFYVNETKRQERKKKNKRTTNEKTRYFKFYKDGKWIYGNDKGETSSELTVQMLMNFYEMMEAEPTFHGQYEKCIFGDIVSGEETEYKS